MRGGFPPSSRIQNRPGPSAVAGDEYTKRSPLGSDLYFDPSAGVDGSGTFASPYNVLNLTRVQSLTAGQYLWLCNGSGTASWTLAFDWTSLSAGNSSNFIGVATYPGHNKQTWNFPENGIAFATRYWKFFELDIRSNRNGMRFGDNNWSGGPASVTSTNTYIIDCIGTRGVTVGDADNSGLLCFANVSGDFTKCDGMYVVRCSLNMPTAGSSNQTLIFTDYMRNMQIIGTLLKGAAMSINFKHSDTSTPANMAFLVKNCIWRNATRKINMDISGVQFVNNVFDSIGLFELTEYGISHNGNTFNHCTFNNTDIGSNAYNITAANDTVMTNSVLAGTSVWQPDYYKTTLSETGNSSNYSAVATGTRYYRDVTGYALAAWQSATSLEPNGEAGTITFAGAASDSPANWDMTSSFSLGSDGAKRGVDYTKLLTVN